MAIVKTNQKGAQTIDYQQNQMISERASRLPITNEGVEIADSSPTKLMFFFGKNKYNMVSFRLRAMGYERWKSKKVEGHHNHPLFYCFHLQ
ncbi:MAG: hypothetical protein IKY64_04750 [Bacteroidaceae bacterium]|nr:hypothetical protein [Bacteroidaceae bacterium]